MNESFDVIIVGARCADGEQWQPLTLSRESGGATALSATEKNRAA